MPETTSFAAEPGAAVCDPAGPQIHPHHQIGAELRRPWRPISPAPSRKEDSLSLLNETYRRMLDHKSVIRETFMYGRQRAAQIGAENVFDYSLGNPSVPCPPQLTQGL